MKLIKLKPTSNGRRHQLNIQKNLLSKKNKLVKTIVKGIHSFSGRSSVTGRITVRHKGGAVKHLFRLISFSNKTSNGIVVVIMYDPARNAFISLNFDLEKKIFYKTLSTTSVLPGSLIYCGLQKPDLKLGCRTTLKNIPTGSIFHSLSLNPKLLTKYARSAGTSCQLIQKSIKTSKVRLPSGVVLDVPTNSFGTIGVVSNAEHSLVCIGKAGRNRLKGIRPCVRGIAMNPVDHPHGGRTNGGQHWVTPWGIPTKGKPTVKKKKNYE